MEKKRLNNEGLKREIQLLNEKMSRMSETEKELDGILVDGVHFNGFFVGQSAQINN
jgi:hypothetical protein